MTRRRGSNSRTRRLKPKDKAKRSEEGFWEGAGELPEPIGAVTFSEDPAAVVRSLGPAPLSGRETIAEHYFEAVYGRSVQLASALAAAADLLQDDEDEAEAPTSS